MAETQGIDRFIQAVVKTILDTADGKALLSKKLKRADLEDWSDLYTDS